MNTPPLHDIAVRNVHARRFWRRAFGAAVLHLVLFSFIGVTNCVLFGEITDKMLTRYPLGAAGFARACAVLFVLSGLWIGPALALGDAVALYLIWRLMHGRRARRLELAYLLTIGLIVVCHIAAGACMMKFGPLWLPKMSMMFEPRMFILLAVLDMIAGLPAWAILYGLIRYSVPEEARFPVEVRDGTR